ncbi:MAG: type II toxin-antitoxin system RelB/DinJ family antitoxin [Cloacibacillus sp.]
MAVAAADKTIVLQVRVDRELREQSDRLFKNMGLDTQTAVRFFLKQAVLHNGLPFKAISEPADPFYSEQNRARVNRAIKQLNEGGGTGHELIEAL